MFSLSKTTKAIALASLAAGVTALDDRCDDSEQQGLCNAGFTLGCDLTCIEPGENHEDTACHVLNRNYERKTGVTAPWIIECTTTTTTPTTTTTTTPTTTTTTTPTTTTTTTTTTPTTTTTTTTSTTTTTTTTTSTTTTTTTATFEDACSIVSDISAADAEYCVSDFTADLSVSSRYTWNDRTYAIDTAPSDVMSGGFAYIRPNLEGPSSGCWEGGVSVTLAADARVVVACAGGKNSFATANDGTQSVGSWVPINAGATYDMGNTVYDITLDFFEATIPAGEATICCDNTWATGIFFRRA